MSGDVVYCEPINLDNAFSKIMREMAKKNLDLIGKTVQDLPRRFQNASVGFYFSVLNTRTGRLKQAIEHAGFVREVGNDSVEVGMRVEVDYARILHEGGKTKPHVILPKDKKALYWSGAAHPMKRVNHPGSTIRARKYLSIPMTTVMEDSIKKLKEEITF